MRIATLTPTTSSWTWIWGNVREIERRPDYPSHNAGYTEKHEAGEYQLERAVPNNLLKRYRFRVVGWICRCLP